MLIVLAMRLSCLGGYPEKHDVTLKAKYIAGRTGELSLAGAAKLAAAADVAGYQGVCAG